MSSNKDYLRDPDRLSFFGHDPDGVYRWEDLLDRSPVVVLGEGRSGKTREFEEQVSLLKAQGKHAFFVPIERLHDEDFSEALEADDVEVFNNWKQSSSATGYFFLDAVDELKLRDSSLRRAVRKLRIACEPHLSRLRLFLSCRPADWYAQIDDRELSPFCVAPSPRDSTEDETTGEAAFLKIIAKGNAEQGVSADKKEIAKDSDERAPEVVVLLPLSQREVRQFSQAYAPDVAERFCQQLEDHDLWHLYRLPAEIIDALDQIRETGPLGHLEDQLQLGVQRKLRERGAKKRNTLTIDRAQEGAERIALGLYLLKQRSIRVAACDKAETLDVGSVLTNWTPKEQQELLGKSLFDGNGVGSVRFHHRASQEYLAARRVQRLRKDGMPFGDLLALLFGEIGGLRVVKPSMAPVAAWLSLWDADILREVLLRDPRLLFQQGLPSAFSVEMRARILRAFVPQFAGKDWCRAGVGHGELKRVAHPELGPVIRELWQSAYTGHDSRELLLELIWLTPIPGCADLALSAALDPELAPQHQKYGAWGVIASDSTSYRKALASAVLERSLPDWVIRSCLSEMVPELISAEQFVALIHRMEQGPDRVHGLNYTIYQTAKSGNLSRDAMVMIRDTLADAVWESRCDDSTMYNARSDKDHYQDGLLAFCAGTVPRKSDDLKPWARTVVIATRFGERQESIVAKTETEELYSALRDRADLREAYFWACLEVYDALDGKADDWLRASYTFRDWRRSIHLGDEDQLWLLDAASSDAPPGRRGVAFHALTHQYDLQNCPELHKKLRERIADQHQLLDLLEEMLNPKPREKEVWEIEQEKREASSEIKEKKRIADWLKWRNEVLADPGFLFDRVKREGTLYDAYKVVRQSQPRSGRWGHWDADVLGRCMSEAFVERYRQELSEFWRQTAVQLKSERPAEERNSYARSWLLALMAVKAEADLGGWAEQLSHNEAIGATRISCIELNGFASFLTDVERTHPQAVAHVITQELTAQLTQLADLGEAPILHDVHYHGSARIKAAVAAILVNELPTLLSQAITSSRNSLEYAVGIITDAGSENEKQAAIEALQRSIHQNAGEQYPFLIGFLAMLDPNQACQKVLETTAQLGTTEDRDRSIETFALVFGDRHARRTLDLSDIPEDCRVGLLHQLTLRAYQTIRREDDIEHEGAYSPDTRDNAQDARSFLFNSLMDEKRPETLVALHDLSQRAEFAHMSDRLRQMAYECAAAISDLPIYPVSAFQKFDREGAFQPIDNASLLRAMLTRLEAFEHDLLHAEDSPVDAIRRLNDETQLRRSISHDLRLRDRGVFDFTQEAVVADENRTDIRFHPRLMDAYGTVELKRETWTVRQLEDALRTQLVGQYLRHNRCRTGILLICQAAQKRWQHPSTRRQMNLIDVVEHLSSIALSIMAESPELNIAIKGIDYSR